MPTLTRTLSAGLIARLMSSTLSNGPRIVGDVWGRGAAFGQENWQHGVWDDSAGFNFSDFPFPDPDPKVGPSPHREPGVGPVINGPLMPPLTSLPPAGMIFNPDPKQHSAWFPVAIRYPFYTSAQVSAVTLLRGDDGSDEVRRISRIVPVLSPRRFWTRSTPAAMPANEVSAAPLPDSFVLLTGAVTFFSDADLVSSNPRLVGQALAWSSRTHGHHVYFGSKGGGPLAFRITGTAARYRMLGGNFQRIGDLQNADGTIPYSSFKDPPASVAAMSTLLGIAAGTEILALDVSFEPVFLVDRNTRLLQNPFATHDWNVANQWFLRWLRDYFEATTPTYSKTAPDARGMRYSFWMPTSSPDMGGPGAWPFNAALTVLPAADERDRAVRLGWDPGPATSAADWNTRWGASFFAASAKSVQWPGASADYGLFLSKAFIEKKAISAVTAFAVSPSGLILPTGGLVFPGLPCPTEHLPGIGKIVIRGSNWDGASLVLDFNLFVFSIRSEHDRISLDPQAFDQRLLDPTNYDFIGSGSFTWTSPVDSGGGDRFGQMLYTCRTHFSIARNAPCGYNLVADSYVEKWLTGPNPVSGVGNFSFIRGPGANRVPDNMQLCSTATVEGDPYLGTWAANSAVSVPEGIFLFGNLNAGPWDPTRIGVLSVTWQDGFTLVVDNDCHLESPLRTRAELSLRNTGGMPLTLFSVTPFQGDLTINGVPLKAGLPTFVVKLVVDFVNFFALPTRFPLVIRPGEQLNLAVEIVGVPVNGNPLPDTVTIDQPSPMSVQFSSSAGVEILAPAYQPAEDQAAQDRASLPCRGIQIKPAPATGPARSAEPAWAMESPLVLAALGGQPPGAPSRRHVAAGSPALRAPDGDGVSVGPTFDHGRVLTNPAPWRPPDVGELIERLREASRARVPGLARPVGNAPSGPWPVAGPPAVVNSAGSENPSGADPSAGRAPSPLVTLRLDSSAAVTSTGCALSSSCSTCSVASGCRNFRASSTK